MNIEIIGIGCTPPSKEELIQSFAERTRMNTTREDIRELATLSGWDLAEKIGCQFAGDMNYTDHGGYFYETKNWEKYGYAECVEFECYEGRKVVTAATINKCEDMAQCLATIGLTLEDLKSSEPEVRTLVEIEACKATWGAEPTEDFTGEYKHSFPDDVKDHRILGKAIGWIESLGKEWQ